MSILPTLPPAVSPAPLPVRRARPQDGLMDPAGARGPFGRELVQDVAGPALLATVEYRSREGVAAQRLLQLDHSRERQKPQPCVGYDGCVLARLVASPTHADAMDLTVTDLSQSDLTVAAKRPQPHAAGLDFELTDAVPLGLSGASHGHSIRLVTLLGLPPQTTSLLRAEFVPGSQLPASLVWRSKTTDQDARFAVYWFDLLPLWQSSRLGAAMDVRDSPASLRLLAKDAHLPQVFSSMSAGDDSWRTFFLAEGPALGFAGLGQGFGTATRLRVFSPEQSAPMGAPLEAPIDWLPDTPAHLSALACASNGVVAACLDGRLWVAKAHSKAAGFEVPLPKTLQGASELRAINLSLAAQGSLLATTRSGTVGAGVGAHTQVQAGLYALDFRHNCASCVPVPETPQVWGGYSTICFTKTYLDEIDAAANFIAEPARVDGLGGVREMRRQRAWFGMERGRLPLFAAINFDNMTQLLRIEAPALPSDARSNEGKSYRVSVLAQTYVLPTGREGNVVARERNEEAADLWERNRAAQAVVHPAGQLGRAFVHDAYNDLYILHYAQADVQRSNNRLSGFLSPIRLTENRPEVLKVARKENITLRTNAVTTPPWLAASGRFLFVGLDGDRLLRMDFAPQENGWLAPGTDSPRLQPEGEQPRTENCSPTPWTRHTKEPFVGRRPERSFNTDHRVRAVPARRTKQPMLTSVDTWPEAEDRENRLVQNPLLPRMLAQTPVLRPSLPAHAAGLDPGALTFCPAEALPGEEASIGDARILRQQRTIVTHRDAFDFEDFQDTFAAARRTEMGGESPVDSLSRSMFGPDFPA